MSWWSLVDVEHGIVANCAIDAVLRHIQLNCGSFDSEDFCMIHAPDSIFNTFPILFVYSADMVLVCF